MAGYEQMLCPTCGSAATMGQRSAMWVKGELIHFRFGRETFVGCAGCTRHRVMMLAFQTALLGWWSVTGVFLVPVVIAQNLWVALLPPKAVPLTLALAELDDPGEALLDDKGRAVNESRRLEAIVAAMHAIVWADGSPSDDLLALAVAETERLADGATPDEILPVLTVPDPPPAAHPRLLSDTQQRETLAAAATVAHAAGLTREHRKALERLGAGFGVSVLLVRKIVADMAPG